MRQDVSAIGAVLLVIGLLGCDKSARPAHVMSDAERERAKTVAGWWTSTQDDVGFSASLKPDGRGLLICGTPLETIKGPWWVASSPERLVIQRSNGTLVEFQVV